MSVVYNDDCLQVLPQLPDDQFQVIVTSPPYNQGTGYGLYQDRRDPEDYHQWCLQWLTQLHRVMASQGSLFINVGGNPSDPSLPFRFYQWVQEAGFTVQNHIVWVKNISLPHPDPQHADGVYSPGHFKPINSPRFLNDTHESIFHLTKTGQVPLDRYAIGVPYEDVSNTARWAHGRTHRCRGNTWFIPYQTIRNRQGQRPHPATFPPLLPEMCIRLHGIERVERVLDPFMGIGNTGLAAIKLGKDFTGVELDPSYFSQATERLDNLQHFLPFPLTEE